MVMATNRVGLAPTQCSKGTKKKCKDDKGDLRRAFVKKHKVVWTSSLHHRFLIAINYIGLDRAQPKRILQLMNVPWLKRENVASHLQKYRNYLKKVAERCGPTSKLPDRALKSTLALDLQASEAWRELEREFPWFMAHHNESTLAPHLGCGITPPAHNFTDSSYSTLRFPRYHEVAPSSDSTPQHAPYGQSPLLGNSTSFGNHVTIHGTNGGLFGASRFRNNLTNYATSAIPPNQQNSHRGYGLINNVGSRNPIQMHQHQTQSRANNLPKTSISTGPNSKFGSDNMLRLTNYVSCVKTSRNNNNDNQFPQVLSGDGEGFDISSCNDLRPVRVSSSLLNLPHEHTGNTSANYQLNGFGDSYNINGNGGDQKGFKFAPLVLDNGASNTVINGKVSANNELRFADLEPTEDLLFDLTGVDTPNSSFAPQADVDFMNFTFNKQNAINNKARDDEVTNLEEFIDNLFKNDDELY